MKEGLMLVVALGCLAFTAACTDPDKAPAEAALKAADSAAAQLGRDVAQLAPAQAKAVEDALAAAKGLMARKDYRGALAGASAVPSKVAEATTAAAARKADLTKAWTEASRDVQNLVYAIEDRLDILSGAKKLPRGLDDAAIVWSRETLATIDSSWSKLPERFQKGDMPEAIAEAASLKAQASEVLRRIGMP
ncbi:MAG TPA: hypothetical protein VF400_12120 [Anaeromyxobacteraceae bacterium]